MKAIVIGSGISGLTAAAYLVRAGHSVIVYEQYEEIGGVTATLRRDGFGWDLGPLLLEGFGPGEPAGEILAELGLDDRVRTVPDDRGAVFPDFSFWKPAEYAGPYWRREHLKRLFPEEGEGLDRYYRFYDRMMDLMALARRAERARGLRALLLKAWMFLLFQRVRGLADWNAEQLMRHFFRRPEIRAVYTAILADFVVRPSQFPALAIPAVNSEIAFDRRIPLRTSRAGPRLSFRYILGGCGRMVEAMAELIRSCGGQIWAGAPVARILLENGRAAGVALADGHQERADVVIASGGARETFFGLVGRQHLPADFAARVEDVPLEESVLMVHLGVDFDLTPYQLSALCYYYNTYDVEGAVGRCQRGEYHEGRDGFLIYIPSLHSPELAPPGHHAVTVYTIAPNWLSEGTWADRREELAEKLLAEAERVIPGLRARARVRVVFTPEDFRRRTHQEHHSFGGCAPVMGKAGIPHRTPIPGLWFIGSQSQSGGGVTNVMTGASRTAQMILRASGMRS
ncbi:MAG: NAD(P)/FAD-dependent oxidoreductase [Thermoflexales bacterium]|nr:NAD(P)/FAD-dependent oxidoreductase [Thermoflexales bacterium]